MLDKSHRFHGHGSLRFIYRRGKSVRNRDFLLRYTHNPRREHGRLAVVVSKKTAKSAVVRNRIRRRVYEVIRHELPKLKPQHDLVVTVFSADHFDSPSRQFTRQLRQLLKRADLYQ